MKAFALIAACGLLAAPALAAAQNETSAVQTSAASQPAAAPAKGKDARVCKSIEQTGSRLGATSVCKTRKEWDDQSAQYRKTLERQQLNPSKVLSQ